MTGIEEIVEQMRRKWKSEEQWVGAGHLIEIHRPPAGDLDRGPPIEASTRPSPQQYREFPAVPFPDILSTHSKLEYNYNQNTVVITFAFLVIFH